MSRYVTTAPALDGQGAIEWVLHVDLFGDGALDMVSFDAHLSGSVARRVAASMAAGADGAYEGTPFVGHEVVARVRVEATEGATPVHVTLDLTDGRSVALTFDRLLDDAFRSVAVELAREPAVTYATAWGEGADGFDVASAFERAGVALELKDLGDLSFDGNGAYDQAWDDLELHDAMLVSWDEAKAKDWYVWALAAAEHDDGRELCGLMFEGDAGDTARHGVSVFSRAYLHRKMDGGASSKEDSVRNQVFTLIHELGHAFNLAHSWEKDLVGVDPADAWPKPAANPDARSWMNYPHAIAGFWEAFPRAFEDDEVRFIRHAPEAAVRMGGEAFLANGALDAASAARPLRVDVVGQLRFGALEPVRVSVRATNVSKRGVVIGPAVGLPADMITPLLREGDRWRPLRRYVRSLRAMGRGVMQPGDVRWADVFLGAEPRRGAVFTRPGAHRLRVAVSDHAGLLGVSEPFTVEIAPASPAEEPLLTAFRSPRMGRLYAFGGSNVLLSRDDTLRSTLGAIGALDGASGEAALQARLVATGAATRPRRTLDGAALVVRTPTREETRAAAAARAEFVRSVERARANPARYVEVARGQAELLSRRGQRDAATRLLADAARRAGPALDDALGARLERTARSIRARLPG